MDSFASAQFGADAVYTATRLDPELPDGWPVRVLAGLEAWRSCTEGTPVVRADTVEVTGVTGSPAAQATITRTLSDKLGQGQTFKVNVRYDEALDPQAALPTPAGMRGDTQRGTREARRSPSPPARPKSIATPATRWKRWPKCCAAAPTSRWKSPGHTDSQGGEGGNLALSQARAEAVLLACKAAACWWAP